MIKIYIRQSDISRETNIYIFDEHPDWRRSLAKPIELVFEPDEGGGKVVEPTLSIRDYPGNNFLQELSNALIEAGFRDKVMDNSGEIKRLENHLDDMRRIVFEPRDEHVVVDGPHGHHVGLRKMQEGE